MKYYAEMIDRNEILKHICKDNDSEFRDRGGYTPEGMAVALKTVSELYFAKFGEDGFREICDYYGVYTSVDPRIDPVEADRQMFKSKNKMVIVDYVIVFKVIKLMAYELYTNGYIKI